MPSLLQGYKGLALKVLTDFKASIGDELKLKALNGDFQGILMPRSELGDENHIVLKLKNGYNIGVRIHSESKIEVLGKGSSPTFHPPPSPVQNPQLPLVAVLGTGGTIASRIDYRTGAVQPALTAEDLYRTVPELSSVARIRTNVLFNELSENLTPKHWSKLSEEVVKEFSAGASAVVIPHGTDTMGYTASALSFALRNLPGPVILTAAQRSPDRPSSDAASNLIASVAISENAPFGEVVIAMHQSTSDDVIAVHRGTRARKCHTTRRDTFLSINSSPIAQYELRNKTFTMDTEQFTPRSKENRVEVKSKFGEKVALVKFYPGMQPEALSFFSSAGYKGIILEGTGLGHVGRQLFESIREVIRNDIFVGMTSQCIWGAVDMNVYVTGIDLLNIGVVPLGDMLSETALVKLMWVLGQTHDLAEIRRVMISNQVGEMESRRFLEAFGK
jgi:glutamyl-tRNA(Gln) amidotransferase subunit D